MNPFPDYSAAYVVVRTTAGREGYGLAFTVGRGNDVQVAGIRALAPLVVGRPVDELLGDREREDRLDDRHRLAQLPDAVVAAAA